MILDYNYSQEKKEMCISYIDNTGNKKILSFNNISKFISYKYDPNGKYETWNGCRASRYLTSKPNMFDIKEFIYNLSPDIQSKLDGRVFPKLYTFDIETQIKSKYEFTDPTVADMPILTISMVNPDLDCVVLGTRELSDEQIHVTQNMFDEYLNSVKFYNTLKLSHKPVFKYIKFDTEEDMIRYFFEKFVAKVPIIAGWNSIGYDWCYFTNRVKNHYPNLTVNMASVNNTITHKKYTNKKGESINLPHPNHTLVIDMMDVVDSFDMFVLSMKESMNLDYVASQTLGAHKIDYSGSLQDLYDSDYQRYVFYNAIDSILVQLIDKRFKTMNQFYLQSQVCKESIGKCFSKIALTEALVFKHYYKNNIKIVYEENNDIERGELIGAYVKEPKPGKWEWMCCNDFASLYPSTIVTCNISFDNYIGKIGREISVEDGEKYKRDKKYFVSVNNNVYKNDKPYTLKVIETELKRERDINKYLSKELDATIKRDVDHMIDNVEIEYSEYSDRVIEYLSSVGYNIRNTNDLKDVDIISLRDTLVEDITYQSGLEISVKFLMNSIYGGSSHVRFYFYNMDMANDITGESRWLIHKMESHIPEHFDKNWINMKDLHKQLNIEVDENKVNQYLQSGSNLVTLVYGDTDSLYSSYSNILKCCKGYDQMNVKQKLDIVLGINLKYLDDHNCEYIKNLYAERNGDSFHKFELETVAKSGVWLNVKKRYGQMLLWKDGKFFDEDNLPIKVKGLEVVKASYPTLARNIIKEFLKFLLEYEGSYLSQELALLNQKYIKEYENAFLEDICINTRVNKYSAHVRDDKDPNGIKFNSKASYNSKALALYNWLNNVNKFGSEPLYGGKVKCYTVVGSSEKSGDIYFAFESMKYPEWANTYAPIDRMRMYDKYVLNPFNRILSAIGMPVLRLDGSIQLTMFD